MGRPSEGWKLRPPRGACRNYTVRFRWAGRDFEQSTGESDPGRAAERAARIYAQAVATQRRRRRHRASADIERLCAAWLTGLRSTLDPATVAGYLDLTERRWVPFFETADGLTTETAHAYMVERLKHVTASTVRKELSALRGFVAWAAERGHMPPVSVPTVPRRTTGTQYKQRRRAPTIPLSRAEVWGILDRLPEWSTSRRVAPFPIRARFVVQYETGLRPELIDQISVPEHYRKGAARLNVTSDLDKNRWPRRVPLSPRARRELDKVCPASGVVFGTHDYREHLRRAAREVLPPDRAEVFCGAHLRGAMMTHALEDGVPLPAVQFLVGNKRFETMARYVKAAEAEAERAVKRRKRRR